MKAIPESRMNIQLLGCTRNPIKIGYSAYQISIEPDSRFTVWNEDNHQNLTTDAMIKVLPDSIRTTYTRKMDQLQFIFIAENISCKAVDKLRQLHLVTDREKYLMQDPETGSRVTGFLTPSPFFNKEIARRWARLQKEMSGFYRYCLKNGLSRDEIEPCLPAGTLTIEQYSFSFQTLQYFLENGMCQKTFPEIKELSWQIYRLMKKEFPSLAKKLGIKCWENRRLYCDEDLAVYRDCPYSRSRPHQFDLSHLWSPSKQNPGSQKSLPA